jgi:hypothetical protein
MSNQPTPFQNAIRLLFILVHGSKKFKEENDSGVMGLFKGEMRLHAIDFWVRYPDYLADELISLFEETGDIHLLNTAEEIFESQEPDLCRIPMIRYRFGAYERIDTTLSILTSKGLVRQEGKKNSSGIQEYHYSIMSSAYLQADKISEEFPLLTWYKDRAKLVVRIAGERGGRALKDRQYEHTAYARTSGGRIIPPITKEVRLRLQSLKSSV